MGFKYLLIAHFNQNVIENPTIRTFRIIFKIMIKMQL